MNQTLQFLTLNPYVQGTLAVIFIAITLGSFLAILWDRVETAKDRLPDPIIPWSLQVGATACLAGVVCMLSYTALKDVVGGGQNKMFTTSIDSRTTVIVR